MPNRYRDIRQKMAGQQQELPMSEQNPRQPRQKPPLGGMDVSKMQTQPVGKPVGVPPQKVAPGLPGTVPPVKRAVEQPIAGPQIAPGIQLPGGAMMPGGDIGAMRRFEAKPGMDMESIIRGKLGGDVQFAPPQSNVPPVIGAPTVGQQPPVLPIAGTPPTLAAGTPGAQLSQIFPERPFIPQTTMGSVLASQRPLPQAPLPGQEEIDRYRAPWLRQNRGF